MAILVAAGGGALGAFTGIGGSLGWVIGGIVGQLLFPPDPVVTEGPRLGDLAVTSSAYGAPRAIGFGTIRMGGNIIWSTGIRETKNVENVGGKGLGPTQQNLTYTYSSTFALALGEGPADDVLRIWADGDLIFDKRTTNSNTTKLGLTFRFYPGDDVQLQDPAIVADKGVNDTPAYRGTCYLVFDDIPLEDYGNRIPNLTVEVTYNAVSVQLQELSTRSATTILGAPFTSVGHTVDWDRGFMYVVHQGGASTGGISRTNLNASPVPTTDREDLASNILTTVGTGIGTASELDIASDGDLINVLAGGNTTPIVRIDAATMRETGRFGTSGSGLIFSPTNFQKTSKGAFVSAFSNSGRDDFMVRISPIVNGDFGILKLTSNGGLEYLWDSDTFLDGISQFSKNCCPGITSEGFGEAWVLSSNKFTSPSSDVITLRRVRVSAGAFYELVNGAHTANGVDVDIIRTFTVAEIMPDETSLDNLEGMMYDQTDDTIMFLSVGDVTNKVQITKYNPNTDTIVWRTEDLVTAPINENFHNSRLQDNTFGYIVGFKGAQINTVTGEILQAIADPGWANTEDGSGLGSYDSRTESFVGFYNDSSTARPMLRNYFNRGDGADVGLDTIVSSLCQRTGLTASDLDVTDLAAITVPGYFVGRQLSARSAIEPLAGLFLFDGVESDWILKFKQRGQSPVRTIVEDDLAIVDNRSGDIFRENRVQEVELPKRFTLVYMDKDKDYEQQAHSAQRILSPQPAMRSSNNMGLSINAALDVDTAKQQAEKNLYSAWIERTNLEFKWHWGQLDLDPTDVVDVLLDDGTLFRNRITQFDVGDGFTIDAATLTEQAAQFTSSVVADGGDRPSQTVDSFEIIKTFLLDSPLLRDTDEPPGRAVSPIYFVQSGFADDQFDRGTLYKSADDIAYDLVGSILNAASWGGVTEALGDPEDDNPYATDNLNELKIIMSVGGANLVSVSALEMLNGANGAALLKTNGEVEVLQFQDVVLETDGSYTLSTLLRGRRGTDSMSFGHTLGEVFILLTGATGDKVLLELAERNLTRFYRGLGTGQLFEDGERLTLASLHRALMPYAPSGVKAVEDGSNNIDFTWSRRTRVGGELQDFLGEVPLNEDTEEYEIDILDGPGGSIVQSATGLTTPAFEYLNADIITDFGSVPSTIDVQVYQISAQVGRGFTFEVNIPVT